FNALHLMIDLAQRHEQVIGTFARDRQSHRNSLSLIWLCAHPYNGNNKSNPGCRCSKLNSAKLRAGTAASGPILRGSTLIAMMQAANRREGNNVIARAG